MITRTNNSGFTIVELMISTAVFSAVILVLTAGIMQISKTYYKGIIMSQTQGVVRSIAEDVGQSIQLSGGTVRGNLSGGGFSGGYCIGSRLYMYQKVNEDTDWNTQAPRVTGKATELTSVSGPVFIGEKVANGCSTVVSLPPAGVITDRAEKLQQKMRLVKFDITHRSGQLYDLTIRVVAGDDDLLCSPTFSGNTCNSNSTGTTSELSQPDLQCKGRAGEQYCAVSEITTTIARRVN